MSDKTKWAIIGRGRAGWHAAAKNVTSSGGSLEPATYWTGAPIAGYAAEAEDGALIYDARDADEDAFSALVISGPMCDPGLPPEGINRWNDHDAAARMAPGLSGAFHDLAIAAQSEHYSGLDYVGIAVYRRLLEKVPGVRFGRIRNGVAVWDDGQPTTRREWEAQS